VFNDPFDAARTDRQTALAESLGNDLSRSRGVEKAMPNRLANGFIGTTIDATGTRLAVDQGSGALFGKGVTELEVALFAVAEDLGGLDGTKAKALADDEHGELAGDFVVRREGQVAGRANELVLFVVEVKHGGTPGEEKGATTPRGKVGNWRRSVQRMMAEEKDICRDGKGNIALFCLENKNRSALI
jgi:hypothetical protein